MRMLTNTVKQARAYCRATPHWSEDGQAAECEAWAAAHGLRLVLYRDSVHGRHEWLRALRASDVALLPRIDVLAGYMKDGTRPSVDLAGVLAQVTGTAGAVVEITSGAAFGGGEWPAAVAKATSRTVSGRTLPTKRAKAMGRKRGAQLRAASIVAAWLADTPEARRKLKAGRIVWRSREFANYSEAQRALPDELHGVSRKTLERIFGPRVRNVN